MPNSYVENIQDHSRHRYYIYPDTDLNLPFVIRHVGHHRVTSHDYSWYGLERGDSRSALFQYTLKGQGRLDYGGESYDLLPGQAMLLTIPENHHYYLPESSNYYEVIYLVLGGEMAIRMMQDIRRRFGVVVQLKYNSRPVLNLNQIFDCPEVVSSYELSARAYDFLMSLYEELEKSSELQGRPQFIEDSLNFCRKHFSENLSVEQLAKVCHLSRAHFSREMKRWTGYSPAGLIRSLRMKYALELLQNSHLSVKEIAAECGFGDVSYFIKVFQQYHHFTPGRHLTRNRKSISPEA